MTQSHDLLQNQKLRNICDLNLELDTRDPIIAIIKL